AGADVLMAVQSIIGAPGETPFTRHVLLSLDPPVSVVESKPIRILPVPVVSVVDATCDPRTRFRLPLVMLAPACSPNAVTLLPVAAMHADDPTQVSFDPLTRLCKLPAPSPLFWAPVVIN